MTFGISRTGLAGRRGGRAVLGMTVVILGLALSAARGELVAYWQFNEGGGTAANDFSANDYHHALYGAPGWVAGHTAAAGDYALSFIGSGAQYGYVPIPAGSALDICKATNKNFTVGTWIYQKGLGYGEVWCFGNATRMLFLQTGSNAGESSYVWSNNGNFQLTTGQIFGADAWHHVAVTSDGAFLRFYYDGVAKGARGTGGSVLTALDNLFVGRASNGIQPWNGYIDELVVFNSVEDVASIMNRTHPGMLRYWTGGGGGPTNYWTDPANWGGAAQGAGKTLTFDTSIGLTANDNDFAANTAFAGITFRPTAGAFTLNGNAVNLIGDVVNNSISNQTIALAALVLDGSRDCMFDIAAGDMSVSSPITQAAGQTNGLVKSGSHDLTLAAACGYTGDTSVTDGTLRLGAGGSLSDTAVTVSGATATLAGIGTVGGPVVVQSSGRLVPGADAATAGTLTLERGLMLDVADLHLKFGDPATPGASDLIAVASNLTLTGESHLNVSHLSGFDYGTNVFLTYSGSLTGAGTILPPANTTQYGYEILMTTPNEVRLRVFQPPLTKTWDGQAGGTTNGTWDIDTTQNWKSGGGPAAYNESSDGNDPVVFDDSATGTTDVTLDATVSPFTVTFTNNSRSYTISGSGGIAGDTTLTVTGNGDVALNTANTFAGDTVVSAGTLTLGNENALLNSTLNYNGQGGVLAFGSIASATFGGLKGAQDLVLNNASSNAVALTVGGNNQPATYSGTLSGNGGLTKTGNSTFDLMTGSNTYAGATIVMGGDLTATTLPNTSTIGVSGGTFNVMDYNSAAPMLVTSGATVNISGTGLVLATVTNSGIVNFTGAGGTMTLAGLAGPGTATFTAGAAVTALAGGTVTFNGTAASVTTLDDAAIELAGGTVLTLGSGSTDQPVSGPGSVVKAGGGMLTLGSTNNTYSGSTLVDGGLLRVGSLVDPGPISFNNGGILEYTNAPAIGTFTLDTGSGSDFNINVSDPDGNFAVARNGGNYNVIFKGGAGTLTLANAGFQDGGNVVVNEGTVVLAGATAIGALHANVGSVTDVLPGAIVMLDNANGGQVYYDYTFHMSGGTFDVNGQAGGQVPAIDGTGTIVNGLAASTGVANFKINGDRVFSGSIVDGAELGRLAVTLSGGGGTWSLSGTNTYSGATTVAAGTLEAGSSTALSPYSAYTVGTTLELGGFDNTIGGLAGNGTVINSVVGTAVLSVSNGVSNGNADYTFGGVFSDGGPDMVLGLTKRGSRMLTLSSTNTYSGDTSVEAGTLVSSAACLADTADVYLSSGAKLDLAHGGVDTVRSLYIKGRLRWPGTWGASGSGAQNISDTYFSGTGQLDVREGSIRGLDVIVR